MLRNPPTKPCRYCGLTSHASWKCYARPKTVKENNPRKNKHLKQWLMTRKTWFQQNPPNHQGFYFCYICGLPMRKVDTTLDHVQARSRHPELRYDLSNLQPCCYDCNKKKGSKALHELK